MSDPSFSKDGNDRNRIVARLDDAIEALNNGIAENCGLEWSVSADSASA